ncbi:hypothetical protein VPHK251G3_0005 [Vibrio phage K251 g3]
MQSQTACININATHGSCIFYFKLAVMGFTSLV